MWCVNACMYVGKGESEVVLSIAMNVCVCGVLSDCHCFNL